MTKHNSGQRAAVNQLMALLHETSETLTRRAHEMAERSGTHPTDLTAISVLARHRSEPLSVSALGRELNLSRAATTSLVDRLVKAGHVRRVPDPHDRRRTYLHLTAQAHQAAESVLQVFVDRTEEALAGYSDAEIAAATRFLRDVNANLAAPPQP